LIAGICVSARGNVYVGEGGTRFPTEGTILSFKKFKHLRKEKIGWEKEGIARGTKDARPCSGKDPITPPKEKASQSGGDDP